MSKNDSQPFDEFEMMGEGDENSTAGLPKLSFGKCTISSRFLHWVDGSPNEVTAKEFAALPENERKQEAVIEVDIQEFNPALQFTYSRKVQVGGLDWNKILRPSLFKALNIKATEDKAERGKQMAGAMRKLNGAYICVEDVLQTPTKKKPDPQYNTAKIITVFASRVECYEQWKSTYGGRANGTGEVANSGRSFTKGIPDDYPTSAEWEGQKESALKVYNDAKGGKAKKLAAVKSDYFGEGDGSPTLEQIEELIGV